MQLHPDEHVAGLPEALVGDVGADAGQHSSAERFGHIVDAADFEPRCFWPGDSITDRKITGMPRSLCPP